MSRDEEQFMKLGREVIRMFHDLQKMSGGETGYALREFTYPGGSFHLILANDERVVNLMDKAASKAFEIAEAMPPSTKN